MGRCPTNPPYIKQGPRGRDRQLLEMSECSCETLQETEGPINETPGAYTSVWGVRPC